MTPDQARQMVFEHWQSLETLARRRFAHDDTLAEEALNHVLDQLEVDDWKRPRAWDGQRPFLPFLLTLASHVLSDFKRHKFGYIRTPEWLRARNDPVWDKAYRLLMMEKYTRREAVEMLRTFEPVRERWFLEDVAATILAKCRPHPSPMEQIVSIEDVAELPAEEFRPEDFLSIREESTVLEALRRYLEREDDAALSEPVRTFFQRLDADIQLSEEDWLLLRLRYLKGLSVGAIADLMGLQGDVYKRLRKILAHLRSAFRQAGLSDDEDSTS